MFEHLKTFLTDSDWLEFFEGPLLAAIVTRLGTTIAR